VNLRGGLQRWRRRARGRALAPLALLLAFLFVQAAGAAKSAGSDELVYRGTLAITVAYWDRDCQFRDTKLHRQKTRTYRMPVTVDRNPPATDGSVPERNPFNLLVSADPTREAGITIASATVVANPQNGQLTLYEYWKFTRHGTELNGRLTRSFRQDGLALNLFPTETLIVPCSPYLGTMPAFPQTIDEGARLTGTFTDRRFDLTVKGRTFDLKRRFTARITATR
jgi:hypothetical protein